MDLLKLFVKKAADVTAVTSGLLAGTPEFIKDVKKFISHIRKFHASGESLHEENGYFFLINDDFRKLIYDYEKNK